MEVGKSIPKKVPDSVMANLFEALVGALYLDGGMRRVQNWINVVLSPRLTMVEKNRHMQNHKSILQQFSQKMWSEPPLYKDTGSTGPDHDQVFKVTVSLLDGSLAEGEGGNKKMAEQKAAMLVLRALKRKNAYKEILKKISG
jgi:ribonuclease-3